MDENLKKIETEVYEKCGLKISDFENETESKEYAACRFGLNGLHIVCRNAKITPKKTGQFVTIWKRNANGPIEPLNEKDQIDFFIVNVRRDKHFGQFIFPKAVLIKKGIISTDKKEGKRAFRVYPTWDIAKNKQAEKTQKWQLTYFYEIGEKTNLEKVNKLFRVH